MDQQKLDREMDDIPNVHPGYVFPDADLVLSSSDEVIFQVHSTILKLASGVFRGMLGVPRTQNESGDDPILLQEDCEVLEILLNAIYPDKGIHSASKPPFRVFRDACIAAEKYDMPSVAKQLQGLLLVPRVLVAYPPLQVYGLASRLGWTMEKDLAMVESLREQLNFEHLASSPEILNGLSAHDVVELVALRQARKRMLAKALMLSAGEPEGGRAQVDKFTIAMWHITREVPGNAGMKCKKICNLDLSAPSWTSCVTAILEEMEICPRGDVLRTKEFWQQGHFQGLWEITCTCPARRRRLDVSLLMLEVWRVLDNLPVTYRDSKQFSRS